MSAAHSFSLFGALPPELRLQIWEQALSAPCFWAVDGPRDAGRDPAADRPPLSLTYHGPAPYLAGLCCREARQVLEQLYVKPIRVTGRGGCWLDPDSTVVSLGGDSGPMMVLDSLGADNASRLKHVTLRWHRFGTLVRCCQHLARACPALRTLIAVYREDGALSNKRHSRNVSPEAAAYFAAFMTYAGPDVLYEKLDIAYFRQLLLEHFGDSPPRLHILAPD